MRHNQEKWKKEQDLADYNLPDENRYSQDDEWVIKLEENEFRVGISDFAQQELGDVVFIDLPSPGTTVEAGRPFGVIESVKAVSDLVSPLTGEITTVNESLADAPETVNEDCYGEGWLITIKATGTSDFDGLMDGSAYLAHIQARKD